MIEYHNPEAKVEVRQYPYKLKLVLKGNNSVRLGYLANGFPDSVAFLRALRNALEDLAPSVKSVEYKKGNATAPASEQLLGEITGECQGVIAGYGH